MKHVRRVVAAVCCLVAAGCGSSSNVPRAAPTSPRSATSTTSRPQPSTTTSSVPPPTTTTTGGHSSTTTTPPNLLPAQRITRGDVTKPEVAFSFDAGSDAGSTNRILAILAANQIHASFGITGEWARANQGLLVAIASAGHQIINHSDSHHSFTGRTTRSRPLTTTERIAQVEGGERAIREIAGTNPQPWFRAPYGDMDPSGDATLGRLGYRYDVLWTIDSLGWKGSPAGDVARRCIDGAANGAIYLFHVGSASTDADALQTIIDGVRSRGFTIGSVADVVQ